MASEGPPKKDTTVKVDTPPVVLPQQTSGAPSNAPPQQTGGQSAQPATPFATTLTATGIGVPKDEAQMKGSSPSPLSVTTGAIGAPNVSVGSSGPVNPVIAMQEQAKAQYNAISLKLPLGQGEFKNILAFTPEVAVAVSKKRAPVEEMVKIKQMLDSECTQLRLLASKGLPALRIHGDVFIIDTNKSGIKYGMLMEAIPKHTLIDGKDPATIKTFLPSILLDVDIPRGEAWYMKKTQIEEQIQKKVSSPEALGAAQKKAAFMLAQLKQISDILRHEKINIVDLQILVDERGKITIIDPLDVVSPTATKGTYKSLVNGEEISNPDFVKKIHATDEMLSAMMSFCNQVVSASPKELPKLITPSLAPSAMASDGFEGPTMMASSRAKPMAMGYDSKSGHMGLGAINEDDDPDLSAAATPMRFKPTIGSHRSASSQAQTPSGYRPSSRAMVFSKMPPPPSLVPTGAETQSKPGPTQSGPQTAAKDTSLPPSTTAAKDPKDPPKDKPPDPPAPSGKKPSSPTF